MNLFVNANVALVMVVGLSASFSHASLVEPLPGYCMKRFKQTGFEIKQKKAPGFFRVKTGVFCTTPVTSSNGNLITGCDDGLIRFISNSGALVKSIKIDHDPNSGIASNPEIVAIPNTTPEQYVATSSIDRIMIRFDSSGKVISKTQFELDLGKPVALQSGSYFVANSEGVGSLFTNNNSPMLFDTQSAYLNDPSVRVSSVGENQILLSDSQGRVFVLSETGEMKTIKVSKSQLSNTKVAPDGRVWVSDSNGVMYVIDVETQEIQSIDMGTGNIFTRPAFLKNGKIAFGAGDYVYIFNQNNLQRPEAIHDANINKEDYYSGVNAHYLGGMIKIADLAVMELEDKKEYIWVPTYGGYHIIDDQAAVVGVFEYTKGNGDAETYFSPLKLNDGSFTLGMYYGIDRVTIKKSATPIASGAWIACEK